MLRVVRPALIEMNAGAPSAIVRLQAREVLVGLGAEHHVGADGAGKDLSDPTPPNEMLPQAVEELMREKRFRLLTFCLVGEILHRNQRKVFKIGQMTKQLKNQKKGFVISPTQLRYHLKDVRKLFKKYLPHAGFILRSSKDREGTRLRLGGGSRGRLRWIL